MVWRILLGVAVGIAVGSYLTYKVMRIILKQETFQLVTAINSLKKIAHWDKQPIYDRDLADLESVSTEAQNTLRKIYDVDAPTDTTNRGKHARPKL